MLGNRREFLAIGAGAFGAGCANRRPVSVTPPVLAARARVARVNVDPGRVIRTVTGLRPFRPSGFVVRTELLDPKTVIHNYGHGGAGMTLSWGTAQMAVEEALKTNRSEFAVIGSGGVGLATARLLQQRGFTVTIYTKDLPPNTTSNISGALWTPTTVFDESRATPEFMAQFARASRIAFRAFQNMAGDYYGIHWRAVYVLGTSHPSQMFAESRSYGGILDTFPGRRELTKAENPFPAPYASMYMAMMIEPPVYLNAMIRDFLLQGGRIVIREFAGREALLALKEPVIVNCTGLGAKALFGDAELDPVKGQLSFLPPQAEIDYCTIGPGSLYMFPRGDGILLGGTHDRGVWDMAPDPAQTERILKGNREALAG